MMSNPSQRVKPRQTQGSRHGSNSTVATGLSNKQGHQNNSASSTPTPTPKPHQPATTEQPNNNWKIHSATRRTPYNPNKDGPVVNQEKKSPPKTSKASSGQSSHPQQHKQQLTPFYTSTNPANVKRTNTKGNLKHGPAIENSPKRLSKGAATSAGKSSKSGSSNKPVAALNVLLPPQNEKSITNSTNSSIDSQMFPNNTSTAPRSDGSSSFATYKVELETTTAANDTFKAIQQKQEKENLQDPDLSTIKEDEKDIKKDFQIKTIALMSNKLIIPAVQTPSSNGALLSAVKELTQVVAKEEVEDENVDDILLSFPDIPSNPILIVSKEKLVLIPHRDETNNKGGTSSAAEEYNISEDDHIETKTEEKQDNDNDSQQDLESTDFVAVDPVEFLHLPFVTESFENGEEKTLEEIKVVQDSAITSDETSDSVVQEMDTDINLEEPEKENSTEKNNEKDFTAPPLVIQNYAEVIENGCTDDIPFQEDEKLSADILKLNGFKMEPENLEEKAEESSQEDS